MAASAVKRRLVMQRKTGSDQQYVLALDQGTTSSRAILFDRRGQPVAVRQQPFAQSFPQPGWVEQEAMEIWTSQLAVARAVLRDTGIAASQVAALGIANQRETTILWERQTGRPLAPAIVWQDRRTAGHCAALSAAGHDALFEQRTGLRLDPYFSGTKLAWLLDHIPGARERAERGELAFGTVDSWLVWQLTGGREHVTDVTNAARTLLFDIRRGAWDDELLALLDIPSGLLPRVVDSSGVVARIDAGWLGGEIPLAGIAGDQQAATFGQVCLTPGMAKNTYGTGCFVLLNVGAQAQASQHRLLSTIGWRYAGQTTYVLEGSVFMAGAIVQWLRDGLGLLASAGEVEALAASVPDSGGVYLVPAHTGLGAPYWDPQARGALLGLTRGSGRAEIARAALDAIALQSAEVLLAMQQDAGQPLAELRVDGGAAANNLLLQCQADLLGVPVVRPRITETTALGAAYLAGLAVGFWADEADLSALWQVDRRFEPGRSADWRAAQLAGWQRAVQRALHWAAD
jgi:glycerol kinase